MPSPSQQVLKKYPVGKNQNGNITCNGKVVVHATLPGVASRPSQGLSTGQRCPWMIDTGVECGYLVGNADDFAAHLEQHGRAIVTGPDNLYCQWKGCEFVGDKTTAKLVRHLRSHSAAKPFKCPICPESVTSMQSLDGHIARHTMAKNHACTLCSYTASSRHSFKMHFRSQHDGKKDYKCTFCGKESGNRSNQKKHEDHHCQSNPAIQAPLRKTIAQPSIEAQVPEDMSQLLQPEYQMPTAVDWQPETQFLDEELNQYFSGNPIAPFNLEQDMETYGMLFENYTDIAA